MNCDFTLSANELYEEEMFSRMSTTERNCASIRLDYLNGKITKDEKDDAIGCTLFWDRESGKITTEESDRLWKKYAS